jgi:hypothetical protein
VKENKHLQANVVDEELLIEALMELKVLRGKCIGDPVGWEPANEGDHFVRCMG